ncbi:M2 family metallopeptidase [Bacillus sp. MMSF_3328]|uniref:M2 family metallopeptidase n=1 Tax=Bacillus sp. MMSF_3328 TaxID=3047080 RepID=UPI00274028F9|nr:M2 family metallopeptidase [Bacillus sp. MMSF_3328]
MTAEQFLQKQNEALQKLQKKRAEASWKASTTGEDEWNRKTAEAQTEVSLYLSDSERFQEVKEFLESGELKQLEQRQLQLLKNSMVKNQLDADVLKELSERSSELVGVFNTYRAVLDGREVSENDIRKILTDSKDNELRERAWHASKTIGSKVEKKLIDLVKLRNQTAMKLGYRNFHEMSFELQELDRDVIFAIFDELKKISDEPFHQLKREMDEEIAERLSISIDEIRPWHYADPFFQEAPPSKALNLDSYYEGKNLEELTAATFASMGMEIGDMLENSDLYPREKKNQHAFCTDIDRGGDVRVLCNNSSSDYWSTTMLHEFGHAVYFKYIDRDLPFLLRAPAHTLTTEAIAMLYGRMGRNPEWLGKFLGINEQELKELAGELKLALRRQMLISARWFITFSLFEKELYENPDQDLNRLWWKIVKEVQFLNPPGNQDIPHWAAKIHFTLVPVYYQNYLLGELTTSQLEQHIKKNLKGDILSKEAGSYLLEEFFKPGAALHWNEKIEKATGEKLNPQHFIDQFVRDLQQA